MDLPVEQKGKKSAEHGLLKLMTKNIVICCDGTANEFARDRTNVVKLFATLRKDNPGQIAYYHPGVGTMAPPGALTSMGAWLATRAGFAFGYGLKSDIRDAYVFLSKNFDSGDRLYLFGFSRGAYTIRALTSLLRMFGVLGADNVHLAPYAIEMLWSLNSGRKYEHGGETGQKLRSFFSLSNEFKSTFSKGCSPHFVGLWDTVSSVGWIGSPISLPFTRRDSNIQIGRHAVAIDERRAFFRTNLWSQNDSTTDSGPIDLKQVWFPGAHADVGGGYPEAESGLAKIALEWMIKEADLAGLYFDDRATDRMLGRTGAEFASPDPDGMLHKSLTAKWWPCEFVPKRHWNYRLEKSELKVNAFRPRDLGRSPYVHESAWLRQGGAYASNLPESAIRTS